MSTAILNKPKGGAETYRRTTKKTGALAVPAGQGSMLRPGPRDQAKPEPQKEKTEGRAKPPAASMLAGEVGIYSLSLIEPSPYQPRRDFGDAEIESLAESLRLHGLLQPIVIRKPRGPGGGIELVAGERRLRAAKLLGWKTIQAKLIEVSDEEAAELVAIENLQRKDLNPIERAEAYRRLLDRPGATQDQVAARLGVSQPVIANAVALLKLPRDWQTRIISQEISPTQARDLAAYRDCPGVLREIAKDLADHRKWAARDLACPVSEIGAFSRQEWNELLDDAMSRATAPMEVGEYSAGSGGRVPIFTPTAEQREKLAIVEVPCRFGGGTEERATNLVLWKKLQAEHAALWSEKKNGGKKSRGADQARPDAKPLTPAERKAQAAAEARRKAELQKQFAKRLAALMANWLRYLIAGDIATWSPADSSDSLIQMLVYFATAQETWNCLIDARRRQDSLRAILRGEGGERSPGEWLKIAAIQKGHSQSFLVARSWLAEQFWDSAKNEPRMLVPNAEVLRMADSLGIDRARAWAEEQAGPLAAAFWNLHTIEQLRELAKDLGVDLGDAGGKAAMVQSLLKPRLPLALPRELGGGAAKSKRPKPR